MHFLDKYPFLVKYFENGIKNSNKSIAHSILLYGHDLQAQYDLALYIARLLNCKKIRIMIAIALTAIGLEWVNTLLY